MSISRSNRFCIWVLCIFLAITPALKSQDYFKLFSFLPNFDTAALQLQELSGGLSTPIIYKASYDLNKYVLKSLYPGKIGVHESTYARHAADLEVGPHVYSVDAESGWMVTDFIEGATITPTLLEQNSCALLKSLAESLNKLHHSKAPIPAKTNIFHEISWLYQALSPSQELKEILEKALAFVPNLKKRIESVPVLAVPCHRDLHPRNILVSNNRVWLVDWQAAAIANPYYDLAYFIVNNALTPEQEKEFLSFYNPELVSPFWVNYLSDLKQVVRLTDVLNLLRIVQSLDPSLLQQPLISPAYGVEKFLEQFAENTEEDSSVFLYNFALALLEAYWENLSNKA
jgi:thiamine kinase-like enzyme